MAKSNLGNIQKIADKFMPPPNWKPEKNQAKRNKTEAV